MAAIILLAHGSAAGPGQSSEVQGLEVPECSGQTVDEGTPDPAEVQLPDPVAHRSQEVGHVGPTVRLGREEWLTGW